MNIQAVPHFHLHLLLMVFLNDLSLNILHFFHRNIDNSLMTNDRDHLSLGLDTCIASYAGCSSLLPTLNFERAEAWGQ